VVIGLDIKIFFPSVKFNFVWDYFQQQIYLEDLTRLSNMSKATLLRHFRAAFGITPMIYLRNLRLRHAAELLLKTELSLKEISDQSGFLQMPYFFKTFKSYYEVSPLDYRKKK
jgi:transcriptional regulator GlxA family with amidase domain